MRRMIVGAASLLISAALSAPASGHSQSCGNEAFAPQSEDGAFRISADGTSCQVARAVAAGSRPQRDSHGTPSYVKLAFRCRGVGGQLGGGTGKYVVTFTCSRHGATVRFLRG